MQRLDSLLLSAAGVLVLHQLAYMSSTLIGYEASVAHGHMAVAWFGGSLALLAVLASAIVRSLKRRQHLAASSGALTGRLIIGYTLMEQFERALDGYGTFDFFTEPVFWLGVAAAPFVAIALRWSIGSVVRIAAAIAADALRPALIKPMSVANPHLGFVPPLGLQLASVVSRRGPPARVHV